MQFKLLEVSELAKSIASIGTQRAQSDVQVQAAALQCIAQSIVHRNITPGRDLLAALGKGSRRDALVKYFELFGNFAWDRKEKNLIFHDAKLVKEKLDEQIEKAAKMSWHDAVKPAAPKSIYDAEDMISKALGAVKRALKDPHVTVKNIEVFDAVYAAYADALGKLAMRTAKADQGIIEAGEQADEMVARRHAPEPATDDEVAKLAEHFNGKPQVAAAG